MFDCGYKRRSAKTESKQKRWKQVYQFASIFCGKKLVICQVLEDFEWIWDQNTNTGRIWKQENLTDLTSWTAELTSEKQLISNQFWKFSS